MNTDEVRERLFRNRLSFTWLINELAKNGVLTDKAEMSGVIAGTRKGPKPERIIQESIRILDRYEALWN